MEVSDEEISEAIVLCSSGRSSSSKAPAPSASRPSSRAASEPGPSRVVLSGGNIDATTLISVMRHGLTRSGRYLVVRLLIPDRPGELRNVLDLVARERGNVVSVDHHREGTTTTALQTEVEIVVATRDEAHCEELVALLREAGHGVERLGPPA